MIERSRMRRYASGVALGYWQLGLVTLTGLWLAPFLIGHLGQRDYGLWLVGGQILGYLLLLDLGAVALLPRELAFASGAAARLDRPGASVAQLVSATAWLARRQTPLVMVSALAVWWWLPVDWQPLSAALGASLVALCALFPFRLYQAVLQGLQDLRFLGLIQLWGWAAGTLVTVIMVYSGFGLLSLAAGWILTQAFVTACSRARLAAHHAVTRLDGDADSAPRTVALRYLRESGWVSLSQVASVLLAGSDALILAGLLGPAALVPYACTAKLTLVFANHPYLLANMALPALSEARGRGDQAHVLGIASAISTVVLLMSGAIACAIILFNGPFVHLWVGPNQYAGDIVTVMVVAAMLLRHANLTLAKLLFSLGAQRSLALTGVADGFATIGLTVALVPLLGVVGAPVAQVASVCLVSIPVHGWLIARAFGPSSKALFAGLANTAIRVALPVVAAAVYVALADSTLSSRMIGAVLVATGFAGAAIPVAARPPLRVYVDRGARALIDHRLAALRLMGRALGRLPHGV